MRKSLSLFILGLCAPLGVWSQCTISSLSPGNTSATSCVCPPGSTTVCDLLPDIAIAELPLNQSSNYTEYPQVCNPPCNGNDGRLRIGVSTPIIGYGPLESRGTAWYVCGTDTLNAGTVGNIPSVCPGTGSAPKQLINQRVYRRDGNEMVYWERPAGSMTYHPSHGHQHVDDWGVYSLRINNNDPDPLNWPVVGNGSKLGYCLLDLGNCNASSGYCVDSMGTTLNSSNIPNYGLGGGTYGCNNTVQGISNGYMDTYHQGLDGMWINIPPNICNGTYWVVAQVDPYDYFLETDETNNVVAVPITLTQQSASAFASITANANMPVCETDTVSLAANLGTAYAWSTGDTTQSIDVTGPGTYTVTVTNSCGTATSAPFVVNTTGPAVPVTTNDSVCDGGAMTLAATGSGVINWYDVPTGGTVLDTGTTFTTPVLGSTTSYYAESVEQSGGVSMFCPPADNTFGTGANYTGDQYLQFDVHNPCTLASVKIYAATAGTFTVQLLNSGGSLLNSTVATVPSGESRVTLNFPLTPGTAYRLARSGTFSLFRNNGGVSFPYTVAGFVTINNTSAGTNFYYFYYDWEVVDPVLMCYSDRASALATVNMSPSVSLAGLDSTYHLADAADTLTGTPPGGTFSGPGITGNVFDPSAAGTGGPFTIIYTYTDANGCAQADTQQTHVVCPVPDKPVPFSGGSLICPGETGKPYSVGASAGAASYTWTPPTGATIASGQGNNQVTVDYSASFTSSYMCVTADNVCGASVPKCKLIRRNVPYRPKKITGQKRAVCNSVQTYSIPNISKATSYTWTMGPGASIVSGAGTNVVQIQFDPSYQRALLCVTADNVCTSTVPRCLWVDPLPDPVTTVFGPSSVCAFQTGIAFSVDSIFGATNYDWHEPNTVTIVSGQGTPAITADWGDQKKTLLVRSGNACGLTEARKKVVKITCRVTGPATGPAFGIHPNPASHSATVSLRYHTAAPGMLTVTNVLGKTMLSDHVKLGAGFNEMEIGLEGFARGVYVVTLLTGDVHWTQKLVVQ